MWKATLFKDYEAAKFILDANNPIDHKRLGDTIKGFKKDVWKASSKKLMKQGLKAKFSQNVDLKQALLATGDRYIVEASPHDKHWGSGASLYSDECLNISAHKGENVLGILLMEVREEMLIAVDKTSNNHPTCDKLRLNRPALQL